MTSWFLQWLCGKEPACNASDTGDTGSIPGSGRSRGGGNGNPLQFSWGENPMDRGNWQAAVELDTTEQLSMHAQYILHSKSVLSKFHLLDQGHHPCMFKNSRFLSLSSSNFSHSSPIMHYLQIWSVCQLLFPFTSLFMYYVIWSWRQDSCSIPESSFSVNTLSDNYSTSCTLT